MRKFISMVLVLSLLTVCTSGCIEKKESVAEGQREYLIYNLGELPEDLSMLDNNKVREKDLLLALFDGLVRENEEGDIVPSLAEDYSVSPDGIEYTFNIRNDINWSDGSKITAKDFKEFFKWMLDKNTENIYADQLDCIYGAKEYRQGKNKFTDVAISATDENNLTIRLNNPCAYFINILSNPIYNLRKPEDVNKFRDEYTNVLSSGPFKLKAVADGGVILEKNTNYYKSKDIKSPNIVMKTLGSSESALVEFEAPWGSNGTPVNGLNSEEKDSKEFIKEDSKVDFFVNPPINEVERLKKLKLIDTYENLSSNNYIFNMNKEYFKDENFRKSIIYAFCKESLIEDLGSEVAVPTMSYIPPATNNGIGSEYGVKNSLGKDDNKDLAKQLFSNVKYDKEKELKVYYKESYLNKSIANEFKKDLKDTLDINIKLIPYKEDELAKILESGNYDIIQEEFLQSFDDAVGFLSNFSSHSSKNDYGYNDTEFDKDFSKLNYEVDPLKRKDLIVSAEQKLIQDAPMIPIYSSSNILCRREYVKGAYITKLGNINLDKVYKSNSGEQNKDSKENINQVKENNNENNKVKENTDKKDENQNKEQNTKNENKTVENQNKDKVDPTKETKDKSTENKDSDKDVNNDSKDKNEQDKDVINKEENKSPNTEKIEEKDKEDTTEKTTDSNENKTEKPNNIDEEASR